jgi:hypothetical protein
MRLNKTSITEIGKIWQWDLSNLESEICHLLFFEVEDNNRTLLGETSVVFGGFDANCLVGDPNEPPSFYYLLIYYGLTTTTITFLR